MSDDHEDGIMAGRGKSGVERAPKMPGAVRTGQVICLVMGAFTLLVSIAEAVTRVSFAMRFGPLLSGLPWLGLVILALFFEPGRNAVRLAANVCLCLSVPLTVFVHTVVPSDLDREPFIAVRPIPSAPDLFGIALVAVVALCLNQAVASDWFKHRS